MLRKLLRAVLLLLATTFVSCALPPERNPALAYQSPVVLEVQLTGATPRDLAREDGALTAMKRLNRSRSPTERPVRVVFGQGPELSVRVGTLNVFTASSRPTGELLVDPLIRHDSVDTDAGIHVTLAMYDAVLVAGMAARQGELPPHEWLRAQSGWRLALGMTHFRDGDTAPTGTRIASP
jgi:hypothetical protein